MSEGFASTFQKCRQLAQLSRSLPVLSLLRIALLSIPALLLAVISFVVVVSRSIGRDSGVFLYSGQTIARGGIPYVDAWDHKGPLLYIFNAAGARLTDGDILGVSLIEAGLLVTGTAIFTAVWAKIGGALAASLAGVAVALSYSQVFDGGNFSETWTFPFALVAYALVAAGSQRQPGPLAGAIPGIALGVAGAVAGLTRPSNALGLLVAAFWYILRWPLPGSTRTSRAGSVLVSGSLVVLPVAAYLVSVGAWSAMVDQYVIYNFAYSGYSSAGDRLLAALRVFQMSVGSPVTLVALVMALVLLGKPRSAIPNESFSSLRSAGMMLVTAAALDFIGANLSGRGFAHYVVTVLPALGSAAALLITAAASTGPLANATRSYARSLSFVAIAVLMATGLGALRGPASTLTSLASTGLSNPNSNLSVVVSEIERRTGPQDLIYVWGAETSFLSAAKRVSASSLTYYYPVTRPFGDFSAAGKQLAADLRQGPPVLILRVPNRECPFENPCDVAPLAEAHAFVAENYKLDTVLGGVEFWIPR